MYQLNFEMNEAAAAALDRIKERDSDQTINESILLAEKKSSISRDRDMLDEFTLESLTSKLKADRYIYDVVLANVEESEDVSELLNSVICSMSNVYETLNVSPLAYKFTDSDMVNNSELDNAEKAKIIVSEYMTENLFKLSSEKKEKRYKLRVSTEAQTFMETYGISADVATDYAYKTAVVHDLFEAMHFPKYAKLYLEDCLSSETYAEFFETDVLEKSYHDYHTNLKTLAYLVATTI